MLSIIIRILAAIAILFFSTVLFVHPHLSFANPVDNTYTKIRWNNLFGDDANQYTLNGVQLDKKKKEVVVLVSARLVENSSEAHLLLWRINYGGVLISAIEVMSTAKLGKDVHLIKAYTGEDGFLLMVKNRERDYSVMRLSFNGKLYKVRKITNISYKSRIAGMLMTQDKGLLLIGYDSAGVFVLKINEDNEILWKNIVNEDVKDIVMDVLVDHNDDIYVVGNSGTFDQYMNGPSKLWVKKFSPVGNLSDSIELSGRYGSISTNNWWKGVTIAYDEGVSIGQKAGVIAFGENLEIKWKATNVIEIDRGMSRFKISVGKKGFVMIGANSVNLIISYIDKSVAVGRTYSINDARGLDYQLLSDGDATFVVSEAIHWNKELKPNNKIILIRLNN